MAAAISKHSLVFAYLAAVVPALLMAVSQPVWSVIDEAQHFDFIVQLAHGVYPIADETLVGADTLEVMRSTGVFGARAGTNPVPDLTDIGPPPPSMSARVNAAWMLRHKWQLSHESVQTPVYYLSMVPVWWIADRLGGTFAAIYALRVVNALILATLAPMAVVVARTLSPARSDVAGVAALFAILLPGMDLNGTRVSNDALAAAIGGLIVLLAVRWAGEKWTWRRAALMGVILGLGLLVKLTLAGLIPALVLSALWPSAQSRMTSLARATLSLVIAALFLSPWFLVNRQNYGTVMPGAHAARLSDSVPGTLTAPFIPFDVAVFHLTYWTGEPWGALPLVVLMSVMGAVIVLMVPVGVANLLRLRVLGVSRGPLVVAVVATAGLVALSLLLPAIGGFEFAGPGRYAYPALPAGAVLCAIGLLSVMPNPLAQRTLAAAYAVLASAMLVGGAAGLPAMPDAGPRTPPALATLVNVSASGRLDGVTINVDRVALDPAAQAMWFEVRVSNVGPGEMEWSAVPVASNGGMAVNGEYRMSTQLPGDIDVGQAVTGWLMVRLNPASLAHGEPVRLRFADVAVDNYARVEVIEVSVNLPLVSSAFLARPA